MAPVFLLGGAGFAWVRPGFEYRIQLVRRLAMPLAVPCLIFTSLMQTRIAPEALTVVALAAIAGYTAITGGGVSGAAVGGASGAHLSGADDFWKYRQSGRATGTFFL